MNEKQRQVCEKLEWSAHELGDGTVELEKYSPAGEDFFAIVSLEGFVRNVREYADGFDTDDHIDMWVHAKESGTSGVPGYKVLVEDADAIKEMLLELAEALEELGEDEDA